MKKFQAKDLLYGGLLELLQNRENFYHSTVGSSYNYFTDQGVEALKEFTKEMATIILRAEEESLNERAKDLMIKGLKGEKI
jgi:hypothetical protein